MNLNMNFPEGMQAGISRGLMFKFKCMFKYNRPQRHRTFSYPPTVSAGIPERNSLCMACPPA